MVILHQFINLPITLLNFILNLPNSTNLILISSIIIINYEDLSVSISCSPNHQSK